MLARARLLSMPGADTATSEMGAALHLFVPRSAVFEAEGRSFVWLADQVEKVARRTAVTPSTITLDDWLAVTDGLRPGDRVIIDAPSDLTNGQRIRMVEE